MTDDEQPVSTSETARAKQWVSKQHPWFQHLGLDVIQVTSDGVVHARLPVQPWSGSPYGSWNGGAVKAAVLASGQLSARAVLGAPARLMWVQSHFLAGAPLALPLWVSARLVHPVSPSRPLVFMEWYQQTPDGEHTTYGSATGLFVKARRTVVEEPQIDYSPLAAAQVGTPTQVVREEITANPFFGHLQLQAVQVNTPDCEGALLALDPTDWMLNSQGDVSTAVLAAFADAALCYALMHDGSEDPATKDLYMYSRAPAPATARLYARTTSTALRSGGHDVRGQLYYLGIDGSPVLVTAISATIVTK